MKNYSKLMLCGLFFSCSILCIEPFKPTLPSIPEEHSVRFVDAPAEVPASAKTPGEKAAEIAAKTASEPAADQNVFNYTMQTNAITAATANAVAELGKIFELSSKQQVSLTRLIRNAKIYNDWEPFRIEFSKILVQDHLTSDQIDQIIRAFEAAAETGTMQTFANKFNSWFTSAKVSLSDAFQSLADFFSSSPASPSIPASGSGAVLLPAPAIEPAAHAPSIPTSMPSTRVLSISFSGDISNPGELSAYTIDAMNSLTDKPEIAAKILYPNGNTSSMTPQQAFQALFKLLGSKDASDLANQSALVQRLGLPSLEGKADAEQQSIMTAAKSIIIEAKSEYRPTASTPAPSTSSASGSTSSAPTPTESGFDFSASN